MSKYLLSFVALLLCSFPATAQTDIVARSLAAQALQAGTDAAGATRASIYQGSLDEAVKAQRARRSIWTGDNWTLAAPTVTAGAAVNAGVGIANAPGWQIVITAATVCSDGGGRVGFNYDVDFKQAWYASISNASASSQLPYSIQQFTAVFGANGGCAAIPLPSGFVLAENSNLGLRYYSNTTTGLRVSMVVSGYELPIGKHADAKIRVNVISDSNGAGNNLGNDANGNAYLGTTQWFNVFEQLARAGGKDVGIFANYSEDSRTCEEMAYNVRVGRFSAPADIWLVACGSNDARSAKYTSTAQTQAAIQAFVDYRDKNYPATKIIFVGPPPSDVADLTGSNRLVNVRAAIAGKVAALKAAGTTGVDYFDSTTVIALGATAATDLTFQTSERSAGNRLHLSGGATGSPALGAGLYAAEKAFLGL